MFRQMYIFPHLSHQRQLCSSGGRRSPSRLWETWGLPRPAGGHFPARVFPCPLQQQPKARKPRSKSKSKVDLLRKSIEDKIQLFEEQAPEDLVEKVSPSALSILAAHTGLMPPHSQGAQSPQGRDCPSPSALCGSAVLLQRGPTRAPHASPPSCLQPSSTSSPDLWIVQGAPHLLLPP